MKKSHLKLYVDGFSARLPNKKINLRIEQDDIRIQFNMVDKDAHLPATGHHCLRGKVRVTELLLSKDSFETMITAYCQYIKNKPL